MFTWFFGSILIGLLISALQNTSTFSVNENKAFVGITNSFSAIKLLSVWARYLSAVNRKIKYSKLKRLRIKLNEAAQEFKQKRLLTHKNQQKSTNKLKKDLQIIRNQIKKSSITLNELIKLYE